MSFQSHEVGVLLRAALKCAHRGSGSLKNSLKGTQPGNAEDRFQTQAIWFQVLSVSVGFKGKIGGNLTDNPNTILHIQHAPSKLYEIASTPTGKQAALISLLSSPSTHIVLRASSKFWFWLCCSFTRELLLALHCLFFHSDFVLVLSPTILPTPYPMSLFRLFLPG